MLKLGSIYPMDPTYRGVHWMGGMLDLLHRLAALNGLAGHMRAVVFPPLA